MEVMTALAIFMCLLPSIVCIIMHIFKKHPHVPTSSLSSTPKHPDGEEYVSKATDAHRDNSLADKADTRFTNIVKNPWEDIL